MDGALRSRGIAGFTLIEMLVSMTILVLLIVLLGRLVSGLTLAVSGTTSQIGQFQEAREAFETITRRISQATLNSYDDANPHLSGTVPYSRASELRFISGNAESVGNATGLITPATTGYPTHCIFFQAPLGYALASGTNSAYAGLVNLMNTVGYFIQWTSDGDKSGAAAGLKLRPQFLPANIAPRYRMRLMEMIEPSDYLTVYSHTSGAYPDTSGTTSQCWYYTGHEWFLNPLTATYQFGGQTIPASVHPIAENVIFLMLLPMVAPQNAQSPPGGNPDGTSTDLASTYTYDSSPSQSGSLPLPASQNQLPPMVYIMMIAVDEKSFARYEAGRASPSDDPSGDLGITGAGSEGTGFLTNSTYQYRMGTPGNPNSGDIYQVTSALASHHIGYRIFTAAVSLTPN